MLGRFFLSQLFRRADGLMVYWDFRACDEFAKSKKLAYKTIPAIAYRFNLSPLSHYVAMETVLFFGGEMVKYLFS